MLQVLGLQNYSTETLLLLGGFVLLVGFITGYITDIVMGDRGFGPVGNGLLAIFGGVMGFFIRNALLGPMDKSDIVMTAFVAASTATLLLLILGVVKSWIQN